MEMMSTWACRTGYHDECGLLPWVLDLEGEVWSIFVKSRASKLLVTSMASSLWSMLSFLVLVVLEAESFLVVAGDFWEVFFVVVQVSM
eukprot:CCRYP_012976-RA/>CCRYP_012976-RA protein AED:0.46 eAED:0.46 QI:608/0/0.5/1/0/0/2/0/87